MLYICEKCKYLFISDKQMMDVQKDRYRCPDCGKFDVRVANESEQEEYRRQKERDDTDPWEGK